MRKARMLAALCGITCMTAHAFAQTPAARLPAFPGAEGFGAVAVGGRGGTVIHVTNLKPSGPGSFGAAMAAKGPRIIVFDVSGVIPKGRGKHGSYPVQDGRLTLAGQTAPGPGVALEGKLDLSGMEDVIVRHLRIRFTGPDGGDSVLVHGSTRVILDHVSVSWGADESLSLPGTKNATVQYTTIEESRLCWEGGDEPHNFGMIISGGPSSLNHVLFAHHHRRTPVSQYGIFLDYRNSVIYNCDTGPGAPPGGGNVVSNYLKHGPGARFGYPRIYHPVGTMACPDLTLGRKPGKLFVRGNYVTHRAGYFEPETRHERLKYGRPAAKPFPAPEVKTYVAEEACRRVMACAGALPRDEITGRCIYETRTGTGRWDEVHPRGDWRGRMKGHKAPADSDRDGMPDDWETVHGLAPRDPADAHRTVPAGASPADRHKGYTFIEYYINERADVLEAEALTASRLRTSDGRAPQKPEWKDLPKDIDELVADIEGQNYARIAKTEALWQEYLRLRKEKGKSEQTKALRSKIHQQGGGKTGTHLAWRAIWALKDAGPKAAPAAKKLVKIVDTTDNRQALFAAWALGVIAPFADEEVVVPVLIKGLERKDYVKPVINSKWNMNPRGFIAWALGRFGPRAKAAVPALAKTLHGEDIWARQPAAWALRQMGKDVAPAADALIRALGAGWAGSTYGGASGCHAAHALAGIGPPVVPELIAVFRGRRAGTNQRRGAAVALGLIGPDAKDAIPALVRALRDKSPLVRSEAAVALGKIGPDADEVVEALATACRDKDYGVRINVVKALGLCAPTNASGVAHLETTLADTRREVCYASYRSLGKGGKPSVPVLVRALGQNDPWHRKYAARALGDAARGTSNAAAAEALVEALSDKDAEVRREAAWSLGLVGPKAPGVVERLKALREDDDYVVRTAAAMVLKKVQ
jgi:HEAT repeat protein